MASAGNRASKGEEDVSLYELRDTTDRNLKRIYIGDREAGCVRRFPEGWSAIGGFVGGLQPRYHENAEDAAAVLAAVMLQRALQEQRATMTILQRNSQEPSSGSPR
jgi:hypothetical protein